MERSEDKARIQATLVAFLIEITGVLIDQGLEVHHRLVAQMFSRSENQQGRQFHRDGKAINTKLREYIAVGRALIGARPGR